MPIPASSGQVNPQFGCDSDNACAPARYAGSTLLGMPSPAPLLPIGTTGRPSIAPVTMTGTRDGCSVPSRPFTPG